MRSGLREICDLGSAKLAHTRSLKGEKNESGKPFLMNVWFNEPHSVLAAPDHIVGQYGEIGDSAALYSGTVDNMDRAIGRLVTELETRNLLDDTIIVFSSDHGSYREDRNGGLKGNKGSNFQGGLLSPGIFFWPKGFAGGRVEDEACGAVDLLPTLCGLVGVDKPKGVHLDGEDLSPLLKQLKIDYVNQIARSTTSMGGRVYRGQFSGANPRKNFVFTNAPSLRHFRRR